MKLFFKNISFLVFFFLTNFQLLAQNFPSTISEKGLVVDGQVSTKKGIWSADKRTIYTINWFHTSSTYSGEADMMDSIPILTQGGLVDDGLLVASHSRQLHSGYSYLMALEPCFDCVEGLTIYRIIGSIGEFREREYISEKSKWANTPNVKSQMANSPCPGSEEILYLNFGTLYLSLEQDSLEGFIDIRSKTTQNPKFLNSLETTIKYSTTVFGTYAVSSNQINISPIGSAMLQAYSSSVNDVTSDKASYAMTKNAWSSNAYAIETSFSPMARISFKVPVTSLSTLPTELQNIFNLVELEASYICDGKEYPFREVIIENSPIGVQFKGMGLISDIEYEFRDIEYSPSDNKYLFTVFASSNEETYLNIANIKIDFSDAAFLPFQDANGNLSVFPVTNSIISNNSNYSVTQQDIDQSSIEINMSAINTTDLADLAIIDETPQALFGVSMVLDDCEVNPILNFISDDMQGLSQYFEALTFPIPLVYNPVIATDNENTSACGCDMQPVFTEISPADVPLIAGDNQVLTITGDNFGVYERTGNPSDFGTGSSVLFTNGDQGQNDPEFIAASAMDIVSWTNTEIQVKVPSVGYLQGVRGTAASGPFKVRNRCNLTKISFLDLDEGDLNISYSLANFRLDNDGPSRKLGLRNDNGTNGDQDGYAFAFHEDVDGANIQVDIRGDFDSALATWCDITAIRFKKQEENAPTDVAIAGDNVNSITIEDLSDPADEAGMVQGFSYFQLNCEGSNPTNENGGYILTDIDLIVDLDFAQTPQSAVNVLTHELGHAHLLNHAFCFGFNCTEPLMEAFGGTGVVQPSDSEGANRVFQNSSSIIMDNDCFLPGAGIVEPIPIKTGECGFINSTVQTVFTDIEYYPNPTFAIVSIYNLKEIGEYSIFNSSGQLLNNGDALSDEFHIDLSSYPQGTYFVHIVTSNESGYVKIIKL